MPFCDTEHESNKQKVKITKSQWSYIFEHWIKRAVESYKPNKIVCKRSLAKPGSFIKDIVVDLANADLVIADLTGARPNVYYELGIRHALRVGTIIITQNFAAFPSDLSNYFVFSYDYSDKDHEYDEYYGQFEKKMHETLKAWDEAEDPSDNPVSDFLGIKNQLREKELEYEKELMQRILSRLKKHLKHNFEVCETLHGLINGKSQESVKQALMFDVSAIDIIYSRLSGYDWKILKEIGFEAMEDTIIDHRRLINEISVTREKVEISNEEMKHDFFIYLHSLLEQAAVAKEHFDKEWDDLIQVIDAIELPSKGAAKDFTP